ncbi:hypothetical protein G5V65_00120 [Rhodobacter sp. HX-7-19]|uniref:Uncharacterized protein n=2 Tax=Paragemmobacter kunshanensis TaxID=2583234 RepID=A0A6M1U3A2_9RHOB|nr:hypothetical protein [Rhodobacter kunshanensis]
MALAFNLAYLNLPIFHFLSQISEAVGTKIDALPDSTKRHVENTPWFKDAVQIAKVKNLERVQFHNSRSGSLWTPFSNKLCAVLFNVLFKFRLAKVLSILLTATCCQLIILGVMIDIMPSAMVTAVLVQHTPAPFFLALLSFLWPIIVIGAGASIRIITVRQLNYTLAGLGVTAMDEAEEALKKAEQVVEAK